MDRRADLANQLAHVTTDEKAERIVRCFLEELAKDCPKPLLVKIGQCVLDYRNEELGHENN